MLPLYLASRSPRRKDLLAQASIRFRVHVPEEPELAAPRTRQRTSPATIVRTISAAKAKACVKELAQSGGKEFVVLAADTLVFLGNKVLSKPESEADAKRMLKALSGRWHTVYTGVTVILHEKGKTKAKSMHVATRVKFFPLRPEWIAWYVRTGEPMDKAGAYGAQGFGAALVEIFSGSYTNVVGLPLGHSLALLEEVTGYHRSKFQTPAEAEAQGG
jgi:septum formation protein